MAYIEQLLAKHGSCVICVAEGAGQELLGGWGEGVAPPTDASGTPARACVCVFVTVCVCACVCVHVCMTVYCMCVGWKSTVCV